MMYPEDLKYSIEHEWIKVEGNKGKVGITHYAQDTLGDVVFVELPAEGDRFAVGETFGVVESVKAVSDLYAPVTGKVVAINEEILDKPELVNKDPYVQGWMIELELENLQELDQLLTAEAYQKLVKGED
ncbi:MAG: glycine cleavage system protein GcvH [Bacillota bacterium]